MANVRVPQPVSLEVAIKLYYEKSELNNKDISTLFGNVSSASIARLKKRVRQQMAEDAVPVWNALCVNTKTAYKVWGLDINELEERFNKLKKLGLS